MNLGISNKLNMKKEKYFFEIIPKEYTGLVIAACGVLFWVGSCR